MKWRPFYLPREFTVVYLPLTANANSANYTRALADSRGAILTQFHYCGDFNHVDLRIALHKFHQRVKCRSTRRFNTLDKLYSNINLGYRAKQLPRLTQYAPVTGRQGSSWSYETDFKPPWRPSCLVCLTLLANIQILSKIVETVATQRNYLLGKK